MGAIRASKALAGTSKTNDQYISEIERVLKSRNDALFCTPYSGIISVNSVCHFYPYRYYIYLVTLFQVTSPT